MMVLSGHEVSTVIRNNIKARAEQFKERTKRPPGLAVIIVGSDPASQVYVRNKVKACQQVGFFSEHIELPDNISENELIAHIQKLNSESRIDGILVQLPLPKGLSAEKVVEAISPSKDADGLTLHSAGALHKGRAVVRPCTPAGVIEILKHYHIPLKGKNAVIVGRSHIVGRPMAELLLQEDATVTICHSHSKNLREHTLKADLVVVAAGKPRMLGRADFAKDAVVVDVGIHREDDGLCGDVRFEELEGHVQAATPVPGGVGPMTITMLLHNTCTLAENKHLR